MYDYLVVGSGLYGAIFAHEAKAHGKSVLVDGKMAFVGSVNMDYRSFQLHFECGTLLYGTAVSQPLAADMARIIDAGERVTMGCWKSRPWYRKALGTLLRLFAMWM